MRGGSKDAGRKYTPAETGLSHPLRRASLTRRSLTARIRVSSQDPYMKTPGAKREK